MPYSRAFCHQCFREASECGHVSRQGLCEDCGLKNMRDWKMVATGRFELAHAEWKLRLAEGHARKVGARLVWDDPI